MSVEVIAGCESAILELAARDWTLELPRMVSLCRVSILGRRMLQMRYQLTCDRIRGGMDEDRYRNGIVLKDFV